MVANVAPQARLMSERRFFTGMALAMGIVTLIGFGPTYYFAALSEGPKPTLTPSVHVHGFYNTAWILLLILQTRLIAAGRRDLHRFAGIGGVVIAAAILVSGIFVAINSERRVHTAVNADTLADPYVFLIFPFASVGLFALFATLGVLNRRKPEAHKRLMLLATASLVIPALARLVTQAIQGLGIVGPPGVVGAILLANLFIGAIVVHDLVTRGRLHPATLWGGGFFVLSEPLRFAIGYSEPWQAFARSVMG